MPPTTNLPPRISPETWKRHEATIKNLSYDQQLPLKSKSGKRDLIQVMRDEYKFSATPSQYESQFHRWESSKNVKKAEWKLVLRQVDHLGTQNIEVRVRVSGQIIKRDRLKRARRWVATEPNGSSIPPTAWLSMPEYSHISIETKGDDGEWSTYSPSDNPAKTIATQSSTNSHEDDYASPDVALQRAVTREREKGTVKEEEEEKESEGGALCIKEQSDSDSEEELSSDRDDGVASQDNLRQHSYPLRQFSPPFPPEPERRPFLRLSRAPMSLRFPDGLISVIERCEHDDAPASRASSASCRSSENIESFSPITIVAHRRRNNEELFDFQVVQPDGSHKWRSEDSVEADNCEAVYEYWNRFPNGRRHFMQADVWYMAQIEAHIPSKRGYSMRVRWLGSPVRTWERQSRVRQIAPRLLDDYLRDTAAQGVGKRGSSDEHDDTNIEGDEAVDESLKRRRLK